MAIIEKRVGATLSAAAMIGSVVLAGALLVAGEKNPRRYVGSMTINHHATYGKTLSCNECHIPTGPLRIQTAMSCSTAACHGELQPGHSREERIALFTTGREYLPYIDERAARYIDLHAQFAAETCTACHTEHTTRPTVLPEGWEKWDTILRRRLAEEASVGAFVSVREAGS